MKKFVSYLCVLSMIISCLCFSSISASAEDTTYTKTIDFDTVGTNATLVASASNYIKTGSGIIDYSTVDSTYTDGKVMKVIGEKYQDFGIVLGNVLKDKKVNSISFTVWGGSSNYFEYTNSGISDNAHTTLVAAKSLGFSANIGINSTKKTIKYDFTKVKTSSYNKISNLIMRFKIGTGDVPIYFDNIVITYQKYAGTFTGAADGDKVVYADENGVLTTPDATLTDGEFAGWVTEDDADTIIPANAQLTLTDDTTYYAVTANRGEQNAPSAPVLENKTANSVTLVANSNYQYSIDGTTWQDSNVFSGLSAGTEYTFYQRYKSTPSLKASPASTGLKVSTLAVYTYEAENLTKSCTQGSLEPGSYTDEISKQTYLQWTGTVNVGATATLTIPNVGKGKYQLTIYSRNYNNRSVFSLSATDTANEEQSLGSVDFRNTNSHVAGATLYCKQDITTNFDVTDGTSLKIKLTMTTKGTGAQYFWIDKFVLTKVADLTDPLAVDVSMENGAAIRLNSVSGIRFYTKVDADKIAELKEDGATVEMGTLIAPEDKISDELTFDMGEEGKDFVNVKYTADNYYTDDTGFKGVVGSIVNIKETANAFSENSGNVTRNFVGRGYVKVTKGDDVTISYATYYNNDVSNNSRSLKTIASAIDTSSDFYKGLNEVQQNLISKWSAAEK